MNIWPNPFREISHAKPYLVTLCIFLSLVLAAVFFFLYSQTNRLLLQRVREQAATYADLISHTREWNAGYGGVYVEKKSGTASNFYLKKLGIDPDVRSTDGKVYTVRNHAIMIDEISRRIEQQEGTCFRNVSLTPLNPANTPDGFEKKAIAAFNNGAREYYRVIDARAGQAAEFRYVQPLYAERTCLECHTGAAYRPGQVLGATSITIPMSTLEEETGKNRVFTLIAAIATISLIIGVVYMLTWKLMTTLDEAHRNLKIMATTDALTGLTNRHRIMLRLDEEFERSIRQNSPLCVATIDIDNFKQINDTHGHPFGDEVLKEVAKRMQHSIRRYDIIGRIGGEEFLVIFPGTGTAETQTVAERLRESVEAARLACGSGDVRVTISGGIALVKPEDNSVESILKRADAALYEAKRSGRNRIVVST